MPTWKRIVTDGIALADIGGPASDDKILIQDTSDSDAIKYVDFSDVTGAISGTTFAADLKIGRDADNLIDFATDNKITLRVDAADVLELTNANTGDAVLTVLTADKNFTIKGTDDSSVITALDIDMAAAGKATFIGDVVAPSITLNGTAITSVFSPIAGGTGIVTTGALDTGSITSGFGNIDVGASSIAAGSFDASDGNITNVGDIDADSISVADAANGLNIDFSGANTGTSALTIKDNVAEALVIQEGTNDYLQIVTTNSSEAVKIGHGVAGTAITIGHGTSEVTIGDNLTVTGDLTVSGTTTTINTTELVVEDHIITAASGSADAAAAGVAGLAIDTSDSTQLPFVGFADGAGLTEMVVKAEGNNTAFPIAIMEFSSSSAPDGNSGGVGSFHYDTGTDLLYIRTA